MKKWVAVFLFVALIFMPLTPFAEVFAKTPEGFPQYSGTAKTNILHVGAISGVLAEINAGKSTVKVDSAAKASESMGTPLEVKLLGGSLLEGLLTATSSGNEGLKQSGISPDNLPSLLNGLGLSIGLLNAQANSTLDPEKGMSESTVGSIKLGLNLKETTGGLLDPEKGLLQPVGGLLAPVLGLLDPVLGILDPVLNLLNVLDVGLIKTNTKVEPNLTDGTITSTSGMDPVNISLLGGTLQIEALQVNATASVNGRPGEAKAKFDWSVADIKLSGKSVLGELQAKGKVELPGILTLALGDENETVSPDGKSAKASGSVLRVELLGIALGGVVVDIGAAEAEAKTSGPYAPPVENLPEGTIIDRMPGYIVLSDPVKIENPGKEMYLSYDTQKMDRNRDRYARAYYWHEKAGKWVALATYPAEPGKVKVINDGNYKGWFTVFGSIMPSFNDVRGHWAEDAANRMNGLGFLEGYPNPANPSALSNRPAGLGRNVTRAEFISLVTRIGGMNPGDTMYGSLVKTPTAAEQNAILAGWRGVPNWAKANIAAALSSGIASGRYMNDFAGDMPITRIEAAVTVSNLLKKVPGYQFKAMNLASFSDAYNIPSWAYGKVAEGTLSGYPDGTLRPQAPIVRSESLTLLLRLLHDLGW